MSFNPNLATEAQIGYVEDLLRSTDYRLSDALADIGYEGLVAIVQEDPKRLTREMASEVIARLRDIQRDDRRDRRGGRW